MKVELTYDRKLILLRFVHFDKFYPLEYQKIALRIVHNTIQNSQPNLNLIPHQHYYSIVPINNEICEILRDLETYRLN